MASTTKGYCKINTEKVPWGGGQKGKKDKLKEKVPWTFNYSTYIGYYFVCVC